MTEYRYGEERVIELESIGIINIEGATAISAPATAADTVLGTGVESGEVVFYLGIHGRRFVIEVTREQLLVFLGEANARLLGQVVITPGKEIAKYLDSRFPQAAE